MNNNLFIKPTIVNPSFRYSKHTNEVLNIKNIISFYKGTLNWYPDNEGIPSINFKMVNGYFLQWAFDSENDREVNFNRLLDFIK